MNGVSVRIAPPDFDRVAELLTLIQGAFAPMRGVIDPPSSAERLTLASLTDKIRREILILCQVDGALAGCAFADPRGDHIYLGKIAVSAAHQGRGIGRGMLDVATSIARAKGLPELRLETRGELTGNHRTFEAWGFKRTGETAHPGYNRPTSIAYAMRI